MKRPSLRPMALRAAAVGFGLALALGGLEGVLRLLPVCDATRRTPVDDRNPILRLAPDREFTWSRDWNMKLVNRVRTNNFGFVNDVDYDPAATTPLIAMVGDSYVESLMVPFADTGAGRMTSHLGDAARVYTFGLSGAPLSQYLAYAEFARDSFRPDTFVFLIVGNDFDKSLLRGDSMRGMHYFEDRGGELELRRTDFDVPLAKRIARESALFRYLMINLDLYHLPKNLRRRFEQRRQSTPRAAAPDADTPARSERVRGSKRVVDSFLELLPGKTGARPERIWLVLDGMRPELYSDSELELAGGSFHDVMRRYVTDRGDALGYQVIDMQPVFVEHFRRFGRRFEFEADTHWNALAHQLFFETLLASGFPRLAVAP